MAVPEILKRIVQHRPPTPDTFIPRLRALAASDGVVRPRILDVGSGGRTISENTVRLDLRRWLHVDVQADAVRLPVRSASMDAVVVTDVLMYVDDPFAAVREIARVLKPGGWVYASEPFLYPDMGRGTFRFTQRGLEVLFANFELADSGVHQGPGSVALPIFAYYLASLLSFGNFTVYRAAVYAVLALTFPLTLLDRWLRGHRRLPTRIYSECVVFARKSRREIPLERRRRAPAYTGLEADRPHAPRQEREPAHV